MNRIKQLSSSDLIMDKASVIEEVKWAWKRNIRTRIRCSVAKKCKIAVVLQQLSNMVVPHLLHVVFHYDIIYVRTYLVVL